MAVHQEVWFSAGYAAFLIVAARGLELLGRCTAWHVHRTKTTGFRRDPDLPAWRCAEGHFLWLRDVDRTRGIARYRAHGHVCRTCLARPGCTDSDEGREIVEPIGPWTRTELGRFHRGLSLTLVVLAGWLLVLEAVRHPRGADLWLLATGLACVLVAGRRLLGRMRSRTSPPATGQLEATLR